MSPDDMKKRFVTEIKLRGADDQYIDRNEEREILQIAIQTGVNFDAARIELARVCDAEGFVLESTVQKMIQNRIEAAAGGDGKVDRKEFDRVFAAAKQAMRGKRADREVKKMVVTVMEDSGHNKVRTGWFSDWYAAVKREVGMG